MGSLVFFFCYLLAFFNFFVWKTRRPRKAIDLWGWASAFSQADTEENQSKVEAPSATVVCGYQRLRRSVSWNKQTINHCRLDTADFNGSPSLHTRKPRCPLVGEIVKNKSCKCQEWRHLKKKKSIFNLIFCLSEGSGKKNGKTFLHFESIL